jgi:hypothetical protein
MPADCGNRHKFQPKVACSKLCIIGGASASGGGIGGADKTEPIDALVWDFFFYLESFSLHMEIILSWRLRGRARPLQFQVVEGE